MGSSVEPADDDIPKVFIDGVIPTTKDDVLATLRYISKTKEFFAYLKIKCQGSSSLTYPKKNFTVKLYSDEARETKLKINFRGWGEQTKFCLKANYIDHTHARNVCSAKLWAQIVKSRSDYESLPEELRTSPNQGAVDGFPIKVYANGVYQGLYTWNIPKDGWMNNMDEDVETHSMVCGEYNTTASCAFREAVASANWTEELRDTFSSTIKTSWENAVAFVINSTDEEFISGLDTFIDVQSVIDFYIVAQIFRAVDSLGKNQMFFTYDGTRWIESLYDADSTWGSSAYGGIAEFGYKTEFQNDYINVTEGGMTNLLYERVESLFVDRIRSRYNELRSSVLSVSNIINTFERFTDPMIPLYEEDGTVYNIPSQNTSNIQQIRDFAVKRLSFIDGVIATLGMTKYTITNTLTNVTTNNTTELVVENNSYTATLTPIANATLSSVIVTMGGVDVTSGVYADGVINIQNVTGDIVITAVANASISEEGLLYALPTITTFDGTNAIDTGVALTSEAMDWTIAMELEYSSAQHEKAIFSNEPTYRNKMGCITCTTEASGRLMMYNYNTIGPVYAEGTAASYNKTIKVVFTRDMATPLTSALASVDGVVKTTSTKGQAYNATLSTRNMAIGGCIADDGTVSGGFTGTIADFRMYNRKWTDEEIALYIS